MASVTIPEAEHPRGKAARIDEVISVGGGDWRVVFRGVDWETYSKLVDSCGEGSPLRLAFDGKDLEIMTKGNEHEYYKETLSTLIREVCYEFSIEFISVGETTWKRPEIGRGLESDQSYYFSEEKRVIVAAALENRSHQVADYPNPDLAIEIDISPSQVDRPEIYTALKIPEVWRFDGRSLTIERLTPDGVYAIADRSGFLPVDVQQVLGWLLGERFTGKVARLKKLRTWIREKLLRRAGDAK